MKNENKVSEILKRIGTLFVTVPELRFFGKILLGTLLLGIAFLILKLLV